MIYYLITAVSPLLFWAIYEKLLTKQQFNSLQEKRLKKWMVLLSVLPMFLLFVLRYKRIGVDTIGYVRFFEEVKDIPLLKLLNDADMRLERGYRIYVKLISLITDSYTVYFLFNGIIIFGSLYHFTRKYAKNPFVFFFLFVALGTYGFVETGLRQSLAMSVCLWSVDFVKNKKPIRFILTVILAYFFHKSALIFLMIYPLSLIKRYDWMILIYFMLAGVFVVGFSAFQGFFNELLGYNYNVESTGNGEIFMLLILILTAYSLYVTYDNKEEDKVPKIVTHLAFLTAIFWVLRLISRTAERISFYFTYGLLAYFSYAVEDKDDDYVNVIRWGLMLVCLALFMYRNLGAKYLFFWQGA